MKAERSLAYLLPGVAGDGNKFTRKLEP